MGNSPELFYLSPLCAPSVKGGYIIPVLLVYLFGPFNVKIYAILVGKVGLLFFLVKKNLIVKAMEFSFILSFSPQSIEVPAYQSLPIHIKLS